MKLTQCLGVVLTVIIVSGCNQGDERLAEKARIEGRETAQAELQAQLDHMQQLMEKARAEGRAQAEAQLRAQNDNLMVRSQEMEQDLSTRHRFYQSVKGTYEGVLQTESGEYRVKLTLVPSLPPYTGSNRVRQLDEIVADLNNLYFSAQVIQWNSRNSLSAVGCRVEHIRPDIATGEISIASESCPNLYSIKISAVDLAESKSAPGSVTLASLIREGKATQVTSIQGEVHPTTNASVYTFSATRVLR